MQDELIDLIYEASVNSELWPAVLDAMATIAGAEGGVLFAARTGAPQWTSSSTMRSHMEDFVAEGWAANNSRANAAFRQRLAGFSTDHDTLPSEVIENDPLYRDFFRPRGLGWSIGTSIVPMTGDVLVVSLERRFDRGPVEDGVKLVLDPLRPHLARAALLSARLGLERARGTVLGLEMIGLAAAVVTASGTLVTGNSRLEEMKDFVSIRRFDKISLTDPIADKALGIALDHLGASSPALRPAMTFPIAGPDGTVVVAHIVPLLASARDIFRRGDAVIIVSAIGDARVPDASLLEALFDLTPSESRVARRIVSGMSSIEIARQLTVSHETVRTHIKAILRKAGVGRQIDLVRLVARLPKIG